MAYPCLPALNPIQENTDLSSCFMVTLLVVADSCKSVGEDCDGSCHLSHTVTVKATVQPLFTAIIKLIYKVQEHEGGFAFLSLMVSGPRSLSTPTLL